MREVPLSKRIAGLVALVAASSGVATLLIWWASGWRRSAFLADFGGPPAPIVAVCLIALGGATALLALRGESEGTRKATLGACAFTIAAMFLLVARGKFVVPGLAAWRSGSPDLILGIPMGQPSGGALVSLLLAVLALLGTGVGASFTGRWRGLFLAPGFGLTLSIAIGFRYLAAPLGESRFSTMSLYSALCLGTLHLSLLSMGPLAATPRRLARALLVFSGRTDAFALRLVAASLALFVFLAAVGAFYLRGERERSWARAREQLGVIAGLHASAVAEWRTQRRREAKVLVDNPKLASQIAALIDKPDAVEVQDHVIGLLQALIASGTYSSARVFSAAGSVVLTVPSDATNRIPPRDLVEALAETEITLTGVHENPDDRSPHMDVLIPVHGPRTRASAAVGGVALRVDLARSLFPMLANWPTPSETGETVLLQRTGNHLEYLSPSRTGRPTARPLVHDGSVTIPSGSARHEQEILESRDERGVLVLEAVRPVADSPWYVLARLDQAEALAPIREIAARSGLVLALVLMAAIGLMAFLARERQHALLQHALDVERERNTLSQRLGLILERANDVILLFDGDRRILDVNARVTTMHGWTPDELKGQPLDVLLPPEARSAGKATFERIFASPGGEIFEWVHRRKDGSSLPVEVSAQHVMVDGVRCQLAIVRDIKARKESENALRASLREKEVLLQEVHHRVKNNLQVIASLLRLETGRSRDEGTRGVLKDMQNRIRSMALLHEALYRSHDLARVNLAEYLNQLASQLLRAHNGDPDLIHLKLELAPVALAIDQAIPCGLIVNELMTNALKYAFTDGKEGELRVTLEPSADATLRLTISDTGPGLPPDFETRKEQSLGLQLVADLTRQLGGTLRIESPPTRFTVEFPLPPGRTTGEIPRPARS